MFESFPMTVWTLEGRSSLFLMALLRWYDVTLELLTATVFPFAIEVPVCRTAWDWHISKIMSRQLCLNPDSNCTWSSRPTLDLIMWTFFFLSWDQLTTNTVAARCCYKSSANVRNLLNFLKGIYIMLKFFIWYFSVLAEVQFFLITSFICFILTSSKFF